MLQIALRRDIMKRSFILAIIVGTILNFINQGDAMMGSDPVNLFKCALTYVVPYCVSTYGAVTAIMAQNKSNE